MCLRARAALAYVLFCLEGGFGPVPELPGFEYSCSLLVPRLMMMIIAATPSWFFIPIFLLRMLLFVVIPTKAAEISRAILFAICQPSRARCVYISATGFPPLRLTGAQPPSPVVSSQRHPSLSLQAPTCQPSLFRQTRPPLRYPSPQ